MKPAESRAYDAAVECAALCMIALRSVDGGAFRLHMRDALREALHLRAQHDTGPQVDASAARKVRDDVVTRVAAICARDCTPISNAAGEPAMNKHAEQLLREYLDAVAMPSDGICVCGT